MPSPAGGSSAPAACTRTTTLGAEARGRTVVDHRASGLRTRARLDRATPPGRAPCALGDSGRPTPRDDGETDTPACSRLRSHGPSAPPPHEPCFTKKEPAYETPSVGTLV